LRLARIACATAGYYAVLRAGFLLSFGSVERRRLWRRRIFRSWAREVVRALHLRVERRGEPTDSPGLWACNHLSYVDIILLAANLKAVFVSKAEVRRWPVVGRVVADAGTIFIERSAKRDLPAVNAQIENALQAGESVVLFPEGTSTPGKGVLSFRPSLLEPVVGSSYPVYYATLTYRTPPGEPPASQSVCWWGDMGFAGHLMGLLKLSHFDATLTFGCEVRRDGDRKALAERLFQAVQAQFTPVL
jgi:1-acyl-sn-glycerol-3-phosphate acyltransferase